MTTNFAAYYQDLELSPGAPPEEVKRAYFKLLRRYSPETHPEDFKRIRAAYEALKDGPPQGEEAPFLPPEDPLLQMALERAARCLQAREFEDASAAYKSMLDLVPDDPYLLLCLANSQSLAGHPQKAAKTALRLTELRPDSRDAWRLAAVETYSRGWYKKSLPLFRKARELGEGRLDFLTDYAAAARDNGEYEECREMNRAVLQTEKWTRDNAAYAIQAWNNLAEVSFEKSDVLWLLDNYAEFLPKCRRLQLDVDDLLYTIVETLEQPFDESKTYGDPEVYRRAENCFQLIAKIRPEDEEPHIEEARIQTVYMAVHYDKRLHDEAWYGLVMSTYFEQEIFRMPNKSREVQEFADMDAKLSLLKMDRTLFRQDAALIEQDYPLLYEPNREFFQQALSEDAEGLYDRLKRRYLRVLYKFSGSRFQERYPEELPSARPVEKAYGGQKPYVREGKKVGRNDPCPCGSGKKFKRCCMGKGIYD